VTMEDQPEMNF